ncbi:MAG: hypothetical protein ACO1OB_32035 [Archangium sp.]
MAPENTKERRPDEPLLVDLPNEDATGKPPRAPSGIPDRNKGVLPGAPKQPHAGDENSGP